MHKEALECYDKSIKINPDQFRAWYFKGSILLSTKEDNIESLQCFEKALTLNGDDISHSKAWCAKGVILEILERPKDALDSYDKALKLNPNLKTVKDRIKK
jgi:tetratricopeptide (TPR) repeat protein